MLDVVQKFGVLLQSNMEEAAEYMHCFCAYSTGIDKSGDLLDNQL